MFPTGTTGLREVKLWLFTITHYFVSSNMREKCEITEILAFSVLWFLYKYFTTKYTVYNTSFIKIRAICTEMVGEGGISVWDRDIFIIVTKYLPNKERVQGKRRSNNLYAFNKVYTGRVI